MRRALLTLLLLPALVLGLGAAGATSASAATRGDKVVAVARSLHGRPYVWGGNGPRVFDCSGYTRYVYRHALHRNIPRTSWAQHRGMRHVTHRHVRRGDILWIPGHVMIYAGHGYVWHAPHPGAHVRKERLWTHKWQALR